MKLHDIKQSVRPLEEQQESFTVQDAVILLHDLARKYNSQKIRLLADSLATLESLERHKS